MNALTLMLSYKLLEGGRKLKDNFFVLFILGPLILGIVYMIAVPYLEALSEGVFALPSPNITNNIVTTLLLILLVSSSTNVASELYPVQSADAYLDSMPISIYQRFAAIAIIRLTKNLPLAIIFSLAYQFIAQTAHRTSDLPQLIIFLLIPFLLQITALQLLFVLLAAHFGLLQISRSLPFFGLILLLSIIFPPQSSWFIFPFNGSFQLLTAFINSLFQTLSFSYYQCLITLILSLCYLSIAGYLYHLWSVNDREAVERILGTRRNTYLLDGLVTLFTRFTQEQVAAHLLRDLRLTFRFFSSAVYLAFASGALFTIGLIAFAQRYSNNGETFEMAVLAACTLISFSLSAITPALVKYQLPYIWMERSIAVKGLDMYENKVWYARLISLPAPIISLILALILGHFDLAGGGLLIVKLILLWLFVASFVGALSFEIASRPALAIFFIAIATLSLASLIIRLWWLWFLAYPYIIDKLELRARDRTRILLRGLEENND